MQIWKEAQNKGTITHCMTESRIEAWTRLLKPFQENESISRILEIGSYEGQSAMFWLYFFPNADLTCIDPWTYYTTGALSADEVEEHFDINVGKRVMKIKLPSIPGLWHLTKTHYDFDLIYIDGDHRRDHVMIDSLLAWQLLKSGGVMIWDDYETYAPYDKPHRRPQPAIDAFIAMKANELTILENTKEQMFVVKT
jgi:predicted O-methyltransferase YrrM